MILECARGPISRVAWTGPGIRSALGGYFPLTPTPLNIIVDTPAEECYYAVCYPVLNPCVVTHE
jgi:hypothetical protein